MPSKLVAIHDAPNGCELQLDDDSRIPLNVTHATIRDYVSADGFRDLESFINSARIDVFYLPVTISSSDWDTLARFVRASEALRGVPEVLSLFSLDYSQICVLPNRLYGGIGCAVDELPPVFYTSPTADFTPDDNRGTNWYFYCFSSPSYDIHKVYANIKTGAVDTEAGNAPNHFLEDHRVT